MSRLFFFEVVDVAPNDIALLAETSKLAAHLLLFACGLLLALAQGQEAILAALDGSFLGSNSAVRPEARVLSRVEQLLGVVHLEAHGLELRIAGGELPAGALGGFREALDLAALELEPADEFEIAVRGLVELQVLELAPVRDVTLRLRGLTLQRGKVPVDLGDDVTDPQQVLRGKLHLSLGLLLPALELRDARGLLDEKAPVLGLRADDEADLALLHDRVSLRARTRAEEQIGDVAKAHGGLVDEVFALAAAVQAPRDGDLGVVLVFKGQFAGGVVLERERDLGEVVRRTRLAAIEDHVLHRTAPEVPGALLAHAPPDGVDDVGFAATVWADDAQDIVVEVQHGTVHERLEADQLELLDLHPSVSSSPDPMPLERRYVTPHRVTTARFTCIAFRPFSSSCKSA